MDEDRNHRLDVAERRDRLRLIRSENVGPITFRRLLDRYGTAAAALRALPDLARRGGRRQVHICTPAEAETEMAACAARGAQLLVLQNHPKTPEIA